MAERSEEAADPGGGEDGGPPLRRERVIDALCEAFARDQIGTAELERRLDRANRAHTEAELKTLLFDLDLGSLEKPVSRTVAREGEEGLLPVPVAGPAAGSAAIPRVAASEVPERQLNVGIWSGRVRRGGWVPARQMTAIAIMGGVELDFREALFGPEPAELRAVAVMGGIHLIVPPELRVETSGFAVMGGFEDHTELSSGTAPGGPRLRVTGLALMGGVEIEVRRPGESARDAKRRKKREARSR